MMKSFSKTKEAWPHTYHNWYCFFIGAKLSSRREHRCALWAEAERGVTKVVCRSPRGRPVGKEAGKPLEPAESLLERCVRALFRCVPFALACVLFLVLHRQLYSTPSVLPFPPRRYVKQPNPF